MEGKTHRRLRYPGFWRKKVALLSDLQELYVASTLEHLFEALTRLLQREFQALHVLFSVWDIRREDYFYQNPEWLRGRRISAAHGFAAEAIRARHCLLIESPLQPEDDRAREALESPLQSVLVAPLIR